MNAIALASGVPPSGTGIPAPPSTATKVARPVTGERLTLTPDPAVASISRTAETTASSVPWAPGGAAAASVTPREKTKMATHDR
jgi:hypothetical protein